MSCARSGASESVPLTMPRMGLKSDVPGGFGLPRSSRLLEDRVSQSHLRGPEHDYREQGHCYHHNQRSKDRKSDECRAFQDNDGDADRITIAFKEAEQNRGPVVVLVGDEYHGFNR